MPPNLALLRADIEDVFRNAYSFELDWEREWLVALRFATTLSLVREQVVAFLDGLDELR